MEHFLSSNINLLHSNLNWNKIKNLVNIDQNYNNFYLNLSNKRKINMFRYQHILVYLDEKNIEETLNKISSIKFSKTKNNVFFIYLFINLSETEPISSKNGILLNKKLISLYQTKNQNVFIQNITQSSKKFVNYRNLYLLKFPFDLTFISYFSKILFKNVKLTKVKPYKLIVLDCDNTLWGGVLDERKYHGIAYGTDGIGDAYKDFQKKLKILKSKGFVLSISSKNTEKKVWEAMKNRGMILQKNDFISPKINWDPKEMNISKTLNELDLRAADTLFIDDNVVEIERVKKKIKKINVFHTENPVQSLEFISNEDRLKKLILLKEDLKKYKQYKIKSNFETLKEKNKLDDLKFFSNLKQKVEFISINEKNFNRALQLFNKTNQFNFGLNRYNSKELNKIIRDKKYKIKLFDFSDKFGNHGIIGAYILKLEKNKYTIIDFVLSCRVLSRYVEDYVLLKIANSHPKKEMFINYNKTILNNHLIPKFLDKKFFSPKKKQKNNLTYRIIENEIPNEVKKLFN